MGWKSHDGGRGRRALASQHTTVCAASASRRLLLQGRRRGPGEQPDLLRALVSPGLLDQTADLYITVRSTMRRVSRARSTCPPPSPAAGGGGVARTHAPDVISVDAHLLQEVAALEAAHQRLVGLLPARVFVERQGKRAGKKTERDTKRKDVSALFCECTADGRQHCNNQGAPRCTVRWGEGRPPATSALSQAVALCLDTHTHRTLLPSRMG